MLMKRESYKTPLDATSTNPARGITITRAIVTARRNLETLNRVEASLDRTVARVYVVTLVSFVSDHDRSYCDRAAIGTSTRRARSHCAAVTYISNSTVIVSFDVTTIEIFVSTHDPR